MADERWEEQFKQFLRKTGDDFRRAGEDVKAEAQRLFDAAVDPQKQQRVRDRLKELTGWARKTAEDVAGKGGGGGRQSETGGPPPPPQGGAARESSRRRRGPGRKGRGSGRRRGGSGSRRSPCRRTHSSDASRSMKLSG